MGKIDNYQKIYEIIESDWLQSIKKRGRRFDEEGNDIFWYVDIDDFQGYGFDQDEELFLVDCLEQKEIVVYDRDGSEYGKHWKYEEMINHDRNYENKQDILDKLRLYHKNGDINLRNELVMDNIHIVERVARRIANEYQVSYEELVQMGAEYLIHIIDDYDIKNINKFFHYSYMWVMKYLLRKVITSYDVRDDSKEIIRDYMDAKKNVESVYGVILEDNLQLIDEIIDFMIEEYGDNDRAFEHLERMLDYNKMLSSSQYDQLMEKRYRDTDEGYNYRVTINANLPPIGIEELLVKYNILINGGNLSVENKEMIKKMHEAINKLSERDQKIIRMRYGLDDGKIKTQEEIARKIGRTQSRVEQKEKRILQKLYIMLYGNLRREDFLQFKSDFKDDKYYEESKKSNRR